MCGRFQLTATPEELAEAFDLEGPPVTLPRYNIAPTQPIAVVRADARGERRRLDLLRWGLVPHFAATPTGGARAINARAESLAARPTFRDALRRRRCLVPAQGFYEWQRQGKLRQPYLIRPVGGGLMAFAGLWDRWEQPGSEPLETCTIVTVAANPTVARIHDRMPAVLDPGDHARWLDLAADPAPLLHPAPAGFLELVAVSSRVNNVAHDDAACAEVVDPQRGEVQGRLW